MKMIYNSSLYEGLKIDPNSPAFNYGDGFFTTIKVVNSIPENMELHRKRISDSLSYFKYNFSQPDWEKEIEKLLESDNISNARVKIKIFRDVESISHIITHQPLPGESTPVNLKISEFIRGNDPIYGYKSLNYYSNLETGFTVYKDWKNRVLETGFANIFIITDNEIATPPLSLPILPGTYREFILNKKYILDFPVVERVIKVDELYSCKNIFLTNSIRGIIDVNSIENRELDINKLLEIKKWLN